MIGPVFRPLTSLAGKLLIVDLGYWDYRLFVAIDAAKGFVLSRAALVITDVVGGLGQIHVGQKLSTLRARRKRGQQRALSGQRAAHVVVQLANDFINFLTAPAQQLGQVLMRKIRFFAPELFEKNYRHRTTSLERLQAQLIP